MADRVLDRSTFVLLLWANEDDESYAPTDILGPFTMAEAERVRLTLVCHHERRRISTTVPEWAAQSDAPEWTI